MSAITRDSRELAFLEQRDLFVRSVLDEIKCSDLDQAPDFTPKLAVPLSPVVVPDFRQLTKKEMSALAAGYRGQYGVAYFIVLNPDEKRDGSHPLLEMAAQLRVLLPLRYPVDHPMEGHPEAVSRFGPRDGTLKIYDLATRDGRTGYREQAETSDMFDAHNDGLGYGGAVEAIMFYADSGPLWGGFTYFQNVVMLSLTLARTDPEAFTSLFLPNAITAVRPRGKGAIKVTTPVLFMNEQGQPQAFLRVSTGEYQITWRADSPALVRAAEFLNRHAQPFAPGSSFVHFDRRGMGCIVRNGWAIHGRTRFIDGPDNTTRRVLSRKWFMSAPEHVGYKHVPGMHLLERFAAIYPERFGPDQLAGEWNFDPATATNIRKS